MKTYKISLHYLQKTVEKMNEPLRSVNIESSSVNYVFTCV